MELSEGRLLMQTQIQMTWDGPLHPALSTCVLKPDAVGRSRLPHDLYVPKLFSEWAFLKGKRNSNNLRIYYF